MGTKTQVLEPSSVASWEVLAEQWVRTAGSGA